MTAALAVRARRVKLFNRVIATLWCREKWLFALVGGSVALLGHGLLKLLIALGCAAAIANTLQAVTTLQLNFIVNGHLTWRRRVAGSGVGLWQRWGRFHLARGMSLLVCIGLFPLLARRPVRRSPTGACWLSAAW